MSCWARRHQGFCFGRDSGASPGAGPIRCVTCGRTMDHAGEDREGSDAPIMACGHIGRGISVDGPFCLTCWHDSRGEDRRAITMAAERT